MTSLPSIEKKWLMDTYEALNLFFSFVQASCLIIILLYIPGLKQNEVISFFHEKVLKKWNPKVSEKPFSIHVVAAKYNKYDNCILYKIEICCQNVSWHTWRRYSRLREIGGLLKSEIEKQGLSFPTRTSIVQILAGSDGDEDFVRERKEKLNFFMKNFFRTKEDFLRICLINKVVEEDRLGSLGRLFAVPRSIDLSQISTESPKPSKAEIARVALNGFRLLLEQVDRIEHPHGVQSPWVLLSTSKSGNVKSYTWDEGDSVHVVVKTKLNCSALALVELFADESVRGTWDSNHEFIQILERFALPGIKQGSRHSELSATDVLELKILQNEFAKEFQCRYELLQVSVQYNCLKSPAPWLVSKRDFMSASVLIKEPNTNKLFQVMRNIEYPFSRGNKKNKEYVRAKFLCSGTVIQQLPNETCNFFSLTMMDPGLYVPPKVVKMFTPQRANEVEKLDTLANKHFATEKKIVSEMFT
eukprot:maker-scaffold_41-snap-gene-1.29-mRNA-1 protein AED:0.00 eAED:0.00 QI:39/1/1/1/1/1/4/436/471